MRKGYEETPARCSATGGCGETTVAVAASPGIPPPEAQTGAARYLFAGVVGTGIILVGYLFNLVV